MDTPNASILSRYVGKAVCVLLTDRGAVRGTLAGVHSHAIRLRQSNVSLPDGASGDAYAETTILADHIAAVSTEEEVLQQPGFFVEEIDLFVGRKLVADVGSRSFEDGVRALRTQFFEEQGVSLPMLRIRDRNDYRPTEYAFYLRRAFLAGGRTRNAETVFASLKDLWAQLA